MTNEIILNGISLEQLNSNIQKIVSETIQDTVTGVTTATKNDTPELLTRKETAKILGVSLPTLHNWTIKGVIPAKRIGTRIRYDKRAVMNALKDVETLKYRRA